MVDPPVKFSSGGVIQGATSVVGQPLHAWASSTKLPGSFVELVGPTLTGGTLGPARLAFGSLLRGSSNARDFPRRNIEVAPYADRTPGATKPGARMRSPASEQEPGHG